MLFFVARRLLYLLPVLIAVSLLTFLIASLLPGDLAYAILGDQATPENVAALRHDMGLDQPIWWRYLGWLGHVLQGDFGRIVPHRPDRAAGGGRAAAGVVRADAAGRDHGALVDRRSPGDRLRGAQRRPVRPLHDRHRLRHAVGADLSVRDPADLSVRGRAALAAGDRLCAVHRRPGRQFALLRAAGADAGAGRMAGHHARAALRHDRDPAGGLHRAGEGQGAEGLAHPVRACAETVVADAGHDHRHQYRPPDRRHRHRRDDFCAAGNRPAAGRRDLHARPHHPAGRGAAGRLRASC